MRTADLVVAGESLMSVWDSVSVDMVRKMPVGKRYRVSSRGLSATASQAKDFPTVSTGFVRAFDKLDRRARRRFDVRLDSLAGSKRRPCLDGVSRVSRSCVSTFARSSRLCLASQSRASCACLGTAAGCFGVSALNAAARAPKEKKQLATILLDLVESATSAQLLARVERISKTLLDSTTRCVRVCVFVLLFSRAQAEKDVLGQAIVNKQGGNPVRPSSTRPASRAPARSAWP